MSIATARANGAVTIVNALATRRGAALAVDLETVATVELLEHTRDVSVTILPDKDEDPALARAVVAEVLKRLGTADRFGARVTTESSIPVSRGLKSSSAAATAIALATNAAHHVLEGVSLPRKDVLDASIDAALAAGVTITGAFDDACATFHGGFCVTDNADRKLLQRFDAPKDLVAVIHVPPAKTRTLDVKDAPYRVIAPVALRAHALATAGEWADAMLLNGLAFGALYASDTARLLRALDEGGRSGSVSGTGPAVAVLAAREDGDAVAAAFADADGDVLVVDAVNRRAEVVNEE